MPVNARWSSPVRVLMLLRWCCACAGGAALVLLLTCACARGVFVLMCIHARFGFACARCLVYSNIVWHERRLCMCP
jgi:hypothetical protein